MIRSVDIAVIPVRCIEFVHEAIAEHEFQRVDLALNDSFEALDNSDDQST